MFVGREFSSTRDENGNAKVELLVLQDLIMDFIFAQIARVIVYKYITTHAGTLGNPNRNITEGESLAPEELGTAFLPPSFFTLFESGTEGVGIFFSLYDSSSLFPIAEEPDPPTTAGPSEDIGPTTQVGSPVVAVTVSAGDQTEFRDLIEPVVVVLRLNTVGEGV